MHGDAGTVPLENAFEAELAGGRFQRGSRRDCDPGCLQPGALVSKPRAWLGNLDARVGNRYVSAGEQRPRGSDDCLRSAVGLENRAVGCSVSVFDFLCLSPAVGQARGYGYPNRGVPFHVQAVFTQKRPRATRVVKPNPMFARVEALPRSTPVLVLAFA
jgi:hypothetical protein